MTSDRGEENHPPEPRWSTAGLAVLSGPVRFAVMGLFALAVGYTLFFTSELLLPIFFAGFLALLLSPAVAALGRVGLPDWLGATIVLFVLMGSIAGGVQQLWAPATGWLTRAPMLMQELEYRFWPVKESIREAAEASKKLENMADMSDPAAGPAPVVQQEASLTERVLDWTWETAAQTVMMLALLFFLLAEGRRTTRGLLKLAPSPERRERLYHILQLVQRRTASYLGTVALIQSCVGLLTAAALHAYGVPNPLLWGVMATVFGFMPYVGPAMTTAVIAVVTLTTFNGWQAVLAPPLTYVVITTIEGIIVTPAIMGRWLKLNPIAIFLSMLFWTWVWGLPGAFLSVPILAVALMVFKEVRAISAEAEAAALAAGRQEEERVSESAAAE